MTDYFTQMRERESDPVCQAEKALREAERRCEWLEKSIQEAVALRYRQARLGDLNGYPEISEWALRPEGFLILTGPVGTGKTHAGWATLVESLIQAERMRDGEDLVMGIEVLDLLENMMPSNTAYKGPDWWASHTKKVPLLLLDDLGRHKPTEWKDEQIFALVNTRYRDQLPTIVTTNILPADFKAKFGDAIASRMAEECTLVVMAGKDRRRSV